MRTLKQTCRIIKRSAARFSNKGRSHNCVFIHIPKTGGTSIDAAIKSLYRGSPTFHFPLQEITDIATNIIGLDKDYDIFNYKLQSAFALLSGPLRSCSYTSGHIPFHPYVKEECAPNSTLFLTVLRDPVKRFISHYLYHFASKVSEGSNSIPSITKDAENLEKFLVSEEAMIWGRQYLHYLSGYCKKPEPQMIPDLVNQSITNLDHIDLVGFLEELDEFIEKLEVSLSQKVKITRERSTKDYYPDREFYERRKDLLSSENVVTQIKELCEPDITIYNAARSKQN